MYKWQSRVIVIQSNVMLLPDVSDWLPNKQLSNQKYRIIRVPFWALNNRIADIFNLIVPQLFLLYAISGSMGDLLAYINYG